MRGQVSLEYLLAFIVLLFLFVLVLAYNSSVGASTSVLETKFSEQSQCLKLAFLMSSVYNFGKGALIVTETGFDTNVFASEKLVLVGSQYCRFLARSTDANLSIGNVVIRNVNGVVFLSQA